MLKEYILSKQNAWSPVTLRNTEATLGKYGPAILAGKPEEFLSQIQGLKPYSRKTLFILAAGYYGFSFPKQPNVFSEYMRSHRNVFKNAYQPKQVGKSYEEVKAALEAHPNQAFRDRALEILQSAQRWSEGASSDGERIVGKGGKSRADLRSPRGNDRGSISYSIFRRELQRLLGLSPHALRKLALSRAAARGATAADLCAIAGWSSIAPAFYYLQPGETDRLKALLK